MTCCGRQRRAWQSTSARDTARLPVAARKRVEPRPAPAEQPIRLRYLGRATIALRGPHSGHAYRFAAAAVSAVDPRDADALLGTGLFALA